MSTTPDRAQACKCPAVCQDPASPKAKPRSASGRRNTRRPRTGRQSTRSLPPWIVVFSLIGGASAVLVGVWGNMYAAVALLVVMSVGILIYIASLPRDRGQQPDQSGDPRRMEPEPMLQTLRHGTPSVEPETKTSEPGAAPHDETARGNDETATSNGGAVDVPGSKTNGRSGA